MSVCLAFLEVTFVFSMTTMASSTTSPVARVMPNKVNVDGKAQKLTKAKVPISETRNGHCRNDRAAPILQKDKDHQDDQHNRFDQRGKHVPDRLADRLRCVKGVLILHAGRKVLG